MQGWVYAQKDEKHGWISGNPLLPKKIEDMKLTLDLEEALRFDVDNELAFLNRLLNDGWSLMIGGNIYRSPRRPSAAPFTPNS